MNSLPLAVRVFPTAAAALLLASVATAQKAQAPAQPTVTEIQVPGKSSVARVWTQRELDGTVAPYYSLSLDGKTFTEPIKTSYDLKLRFQEFDPIAKRAAMPANLRADGANRLMIVQYWTQGIEDYREIVRGLGGEIHMFLANHSNVVEMDAATRRAVQELPFVRSVTPFHPAFKLEEELLQAIALHEQGNIRVNILTTRRHGHAPVIEWLESHGATVEHVSKETYLMDATIRYGQLTQLAALNEVQFIDRWSAGENDMDIARQFHFASIWKGGNGGAGVRVEVLDSGCQINHPDLTPNIQHNANSVSSHGTSTSGIVLGRGLGNPNAKGMAPGAFLVTARYNSPWAGGSRYAHSTQLQNPGMPYRCVLQTNSWGNNRTLQYTSNTQNMDLILFDNARLSILNSQSNAGNQQSRPQAWAKNIISGGALNHFNTLTNTDDRWTSASIGPAADGRIKPDLSSFYDRILTTTTGGGYTQNFGGTSGSTPIIAGALAIFYEMWHDGRFTGVLPGGTPPGADPFDSRPNNTTAKAILIGTGNQWFFNSSTHINTRVHQGWGYPNLDIMAGSSGNLTVVDESDVLTNLQSTTYQYTVPAGLPRGQFRAVMVYRDPPGTTSSTLHRINNLDLRVTSPGGTIYHGNNGMLSRRLTAPGGGPNNVDTVECVYVEAPAPGVWTVRVRAAEVNQDSHVETGAVDVDYALMIGAG